MNRRLWPLLLRSRAALAFARPKVWVGALPSAAAAQRRYQVVPGGPPSATPNQLPDPQDAEENPDAKSAGESQYASTGFKMFEAAATTFASIFILGLVGYSYTLYYKWNVLNKIDNAFRPGDPILELASKSPAAEKPDDHWIEREEQTVLDHILDGTLHGHYYLLLGPKGAGKSSMLIEAMKRVNGDGISMFDAHGDIEIFRIRLGKALDFEFHEDNMGSLFSIRGPRDASALLDIERAFNKFEKVALRRRAHGRPLVLIINAMHLIRDDEDGKDLLELIQQRAEQWCASNICTVILNSDDYWVYERLKQHGTRMQLLPVEDLTKQQAMAALRKHRLRWHGVEPSDAELEGVYDSVGGRLAFLNKVAKSDNMDEACAEILEQEKSWFLSKCWILGEEMDDDVMDQQKYASAAMVLAKALVDQENDSGASYNQEVGHMLPQFPLHKARQVMTRADFIQSYDQENLFYIDCNAQVRADSVPMQHAFRQICSQEGFAEFLEETLDRISAIESLGRTRELTIKDLWKKGKYAFEVMDAKNRAERLVTMKTLPKEGEEEDEE